MKSSLSRNFLLGVGVTSIAFTLVASMTAFVVFQKELARRQISFLSQYVQERTDNLDRRFTGVMTLQHAAVEALVREEARLDDADATRLIDAEFPLQADGTRRSPPQDFDGVMSASGRLIYGMGVFLSDGAHIPDYEADALAGAYPIVSSFGLAVRNDYDNFYFFTPHDRLIMFGPDRPDHLMFYRKLAPANLDFSKEEMNRIVQPAVNPSGETRCTSLQRLLQENAEARVSLACLTPAYVNGRFVGAFGSTLSATSLFADALSTNLPGASSIVMQNDGAPLAYPGSMSKGGADESEVAAYAKRFRASGLPARLRAAHAEHGVILSGDGKQIVAFDRMKGPGWYFLVCYPAAAVTWSAAGSASFILLLGVLGSMLQTAVIVRMARRAIVRPLQTLANSCQVGGEAPTEALEQRRDEIGVLSRALRGERNRADELLASLEQRVSERTAELENANAEKSRFLANMSHELRTPLNGVIAISETLAGEQVSPRNTELAQLIVASGRLLERVLTDILDFSKIEAGEMRMEHQPMELGPLVSRVAELHRASAEAKGVPVSFEITAAARGTYLGDSIRLTQVLSNLLSNAVKFTASGDVSLRVDRQDGVVRFDVRDSGIGFDEATKARLFNRFEQADVSIRRRFGGTGLGLAICRSLATLMGGEIDAVSTPGHGACFTVLLPLTEVADVADAAVSPRASIEPAELPGLHILLAEDHPTNQRVVRLILEAAGVELTVVENGVLALETFAVTRFDLVLMDMQMPEMDGLTATAEIRALEAAGGLVRTPIIMLTANAMDEHVAASLAAGADRHLSKPLRAAELLDAIAALTAGDAGDETSDQVRALEAQGAARYASLAL